MKAVRFLLFEKHWVGREDEVWVVQKLLGVALVCGLLYLLVGSIYWAIFGFDGVAPGPGLVGR